jgi:hypothetical protein
MTARPPGWRLVAGIVTGAVLWGGAGFWLSSNGNVEEWLYRIGLTAAALAPVLFTGIYTWIGLFGNVPAAWWKDEIGTALVIAALTLVPVTWPLAYVFWFQGGVLTSSWLAWLEVSGPCVSALAWLRLCWMWLRLSAGRDHHPEVAQDDQANAPT